MKRVMKFGGTSMGSGEMIKKAANIVREGRETGDRFVIVCSAMAGVTDSLLEAANQAKKGAHHAVDKFVSELGEHHRDAAREAISSKETFERFSTFMEEKLAEIDKVLVGISYLGELSPRSLDYVMSFGEVLSTQILCCALQDSGVDARYFTGGEAGITTDSRFGEARPLMNVTAQQVRSRLGPLLDKGAVPVVTGFIGSDQDGHVTTLGRGGSDYTATLLGSALDVDEVWIWTDVDGLMTADPRIEKSARTIQEISFAEATEMAYFGAKVMHPRAFEPAGDKGIPIRIKNTFNPTNPGTLIRKEQRVKPHEVVKAVTIVRGAALLTVSGAGMVGAPGIAANVFSVLGEHNINVIMISQGSSEANISFVISRDNLGKAMNALELALLGTDMVKEITSEPDVCVIAAVGAGMKGTPGVAAKVFQAVARNGVNVRMIAQGSSELNISFVVREADGEAAVRAIHKEFQLGS